MRRRLVTTITFAAAVALSGTAAGQEKFNRARTNLEGVVTAGAPPAGFNALTSSDADLAAYGFPPRPNEALQPKAFGAWKKAVAASTRRIAPQLELTNIKHGPIQRVSESSNTSNNWSGAVAFSGATSYQADSFYYVFADYVVPAARQAYGVCTGSWDFSSTWIGIDGSGSDDVLQAGSESDAYCDGSGTASFYSAWYEWFPLGEVRIKNFPISAGDDLFVEVWSEGPTQGFAYFENYTTGQTVELEFSAPAGVNLVGNSAEWVVERPGVNGGLADLTNYISDYMADCFAATFGKVGYAPGSSSSIQLTMVDDSNKAISTPTLLGDYALWFQDEGSAR